MKTWTPRAIALLSFALACIAAMPVQSQQSPLDREFINACIGGDHQKVAELLERGANPNTERSGGLTVLHWASKGGHVKVMRLLIDKGANVNARASDGKFTPLVEAAASFEPQAMKLLLDAGAKPDGFELAKACWLGRTETVKVLLDAGVSPNAGIASAAQGRHVEVVQMLLDKGANANVISESGNTPLHMAALQGGPLVVALLLRAGAAPNTVNKEGKSPLHMAIHPDQDRGGYAEIVQLLLQAGADADTKSGDGNAALHTACSIGATKTVQQLLAAGADPNLTNNDKQTPLHVVANVECTKLMFEKGAKLDLSDRDGITPIRMAAIRGMKHVYDWLLTANGGNEPPIPQRKPDPKQAGIQTRDLVATLDIARPDDVRELLARGKDVIPEVLKSIESGRGVDNFSFLLGALGPDAEVALPLLTAQLSNKQQVYSTVKAIYMIKPGAFAVLPEATKQQAAESLYQAIIADDQGLATSYIVILSQIGEPAAPAMLRLLKHPSIQVRHNTAEQLRSASFFDKSIESQLLTLAQTDENLAVREAAIVALGYFTQPERDARIALLNFITTPPPLVAGDDPKQYQEMQKWRHAANHAGHTLARFGMVIIDDLLPFLTPIDAPHRMSAIEALGSLGVEAIPRLAELQLDNDRAIAIAADIALERVWLNAVGLMPGPTAKDALPTLHAVAGSEKLKDETRLAAAFFALRIDPAQSRKSHGILSITPVLTRMLENGSFRHQGWAANIARDLGPAARDALSALRRRLDAPLPTANTNGFRPDHVKQQIQAAIVAIEAAPPK